MNTLLNHILIHTSNLGIMSQFFEQSIGLKKGHRPPFNFSGEWLWSNDNSLIHLAEDKSIHRTQGTGIIDHIAFNGNDYALLIERLKRHHLSYFEQSIPLTGEKQVFIQGPEGIKIEIQFKEINLNKLGN